MTKGGAADVSIVLVALFGLVPPAVAGGQCPGAEPALPRTAVEGNGFGLKLPVLPRQMSCVLRRATQ
jgi:hypothetical protein